MIRFLHTADLQLGMRARDASERGERLREARFTSLERIVRLAQGEQVDFILVAGDMFEHNQVGTRTVSRAVQVLQAAAPIPVFVLPGNHDWYDASSVYQRREFADAEADNITLLVEAKPVDVLEGCRLYPCPVTERWSYVDPTSWIPQREDDTRIRIGVAHGTLPIPGEERILPIEPDTAQRKGLDYLALGHTHGLRRYESDRVAYPGTPEQTGFGEEAAGQVLLVGIERGRPPEIEPRRTGTLTWLALERELDEPADEALRALREEIQALEDGPRTLLRLRLSGTVGADSLPLLSEFEAWLDARCENEQLLHAEFESDLRTSEELAGALRQVAERDEVIAGAVADLRSLAAPEEAAPEGATGVAPRDRQELMEAWLATDPPEDEDLSSADVAREALAILAEIAGEVE
ncbi:MAG: DNA repair exonuclease [Armatimonadota bacterium]|nr:DNA repair exonuclease [Armatimonadota bacterium]